MMVIGFVTVLIVMVALAETIRAAWGNVGLPADMFYQVMGWGLAISLFLGFVTLGKTSMRAAFLQFIFAIAAIGIVVGWAWVWIK
jgi:hypothetical protein